MRVSLIGATGNAGSRILAELARRAHRVTAIVRHPERVPRFDGVIARECDANRADDLASLLADHDVVVSSLHFLDGQADKLIDAVRRSRVPRYVVVGGAGSLDNGNGVKLIDLNHTKPSRAPGAISSTRFDRQRTSTGRSFRRPRSSSPASAPPSSEPVQTPPCAMPTGEAGSPTRTTRSLWSTRSSSRAIPGADSRSVTDDYRSENTTGREVMWKARGVLLAAIVMVISTCASHAEKVYDQGASDTSIKIGNTMPYSGPNSAFAVVGRTQAAYFKMINDQGGINGRKIDYISYDDSYSPPKTVEQVRRLVESDEVLLLYSVLGTPTNLAAIKYITAKKVPHLLTASGGTVFGDYKQFPWSMGFQPHSQGETSVYGRYLAENYPNARIGVLYSADGLGRDNISGFKKGLGDKVSNIVVEQTYEVTDPTIDSQLVKIRTTGVDVFVNLTTPKFAAIAIRKAAEMGWKPLHILVGISLSIENVLKPAGLDNAKGLITSNYVKEFGDLPA